MDFRLPTGLSLSPLLRCCSGPSKATRRQPGGNGPGYPQLPRLKTPALMAFASCKPCSLQFSHQSGCLAAKLMGNHWKGVQIRKPRWYPISMISFKMDTFLSWHTSCNVLVGKWFGAQRIANLCRSLDQVATLQHLSHGIQIAFRWDRLQFRGLWYLEAFDLFMHHPLLFGVVRIFSWLVSLVENSFTATECYDLVVSANTSREGFLEGFVRG